MLSDQHVVSSMQWEQRIHGKSVSLSDERVSENNNVCADDTEK